MQHTTPPAIVPAPEHSPFAEIFPHTGSLELMLLEHTFIKAAAVLCDDDRCDRWQYRKVSDTIAYIVPVRPESAVVRVETTDFKGEVSADAFGLMVTLSVLGYLTTLLKLDGYAERFGTLREYALQHPETPFIRAVLGLTHKEKCNVR
ncbi:antirestriction protein [Xenorhabdus innexi]|uniref:Antirestriction protein n=1 Tax=Xenorhabdus innexi TaxID=290109 RepID=A0A1N6N265_9GAMM|nr:antirestriction protein [Xenorhabdus innexi]PHM30010.1 antirestriction protein [Xenorhabdus innexi]SIP75124.1 putative antirestriction protein [Xenorhabdus innexi]